MQVEFGATAVTLDPTLLVVGGAIVVILILALLISTLRRAGRTADLVGPLAQGIGALIQRALGMGADDLAREIVLSKTEGLIRDQTYAIRFYEASGLSALLEQAKFQNVNIHTDFSPHQKDGGQTNNKIQ